MVNFAGWEMPLHYGSQIEEHHRVRRDAGLFDVSHMSLIDVEGRQARAYLRRLLAADVAKLKAPGRAIYGCMLNDDGGIMDDLIVYCLVDGRYRVVANAATRIKDLEWMALQARKHEVSLSTRDDLAMLALQGPGAQARLSSILSAQERAIMESLGRFEVAELGDTTVARTGYTGEDGFEISLPVAAAPSLWQRLIKADVAPAGLGARDTLRLEAGLNLYGLDMADEVSPLECGLAWTVSFDSGRDFIGRAGLEKQRASGIKRKRAGLIVQARIVPRAHQKVFVHDVGEGKITSGTFSPTLGVPIALALVPTATGQECEVESRGQRHKARVIKPPFVRDGQACA
jgi:aminomethyltransferase